MKDINYFRAKGSYSRAGAAAKKKAKEEAAFADNKGPGEEGTDELVNNYKNATPGQGMKEEADDEMVHSAAKKPTKVVRNGKEITVMRPEKMKIQTEAAVKVRSQNDVRAMLFDFVSEYIDRESMPNLMKLAKTIGRKLKKDGSGFMMESVLDEKTLTPAELKKREEIAKSIEKDQPDMPMDKKMAIATAAAKRVAEMNFHQFRNQLDEAKATMCGRCGTKHVKPSEGGTCPALQKEQKVKLKGFGPDHAKGNMGNPSARAALGKRMSDNEKARQALKDPDHNPPWANSKSRMESVELDENVKKAYEIMKPTKSMDHGIAAIKKHMKVDHNTATNMAKQVMDKVKKGEFKESMDNPPFTPDPPSKKKPQTNSDGTPTKPMSRAKQLAQRAMKKKTMGEAKSFDQKFKDHMKFATSKSPAVQKYLAKRKADRDDMNKKNDPNAANKGYALTAVPPERAYKKARKKGMSASDASQAVGTASRNRGRKLPENYVVESHFKVGQKVECIKSGMTGRVMEIDPSEEGKYYTVKQDSGKVMKYAPDELKAV